MSFEEARVLGCLVEKEMATPEYYPLTEGALVAACNQLSNREPVVEWDEGVVKAAATKLCQRGMAARIHMAGARVPKFKHRLEEFFPALDGPARAVLAVLLLRGPQTAAELRPRSQRLHEFAGTAEVEAALAALISHPDQPLVVHWPPGGGRRADTYAHLLCGEPAMRVAATAETVIPPDPDRLAAVERQLAEMRNEVADLRRRFEALQQALGGPGE